VVTSSVWAWSTARGNDDEAHPTIVDHSSHSLCHRQRLCIEHTAHWKNFSKMSTIETLLPSSRIINFY